MKFHFGSLVFVLLLAVDSKSPFPKNGSEALIKRFGDKMEILGAIDFHTIGSTNGPYFRSMDDIIF